VGVFLCRMHPPRRWLGMALLLLLSHARVQWALPVERDAGHTLAMDRPCVRALPPLLLPPTSRLPPPLRATARRLLAKEKHLAQVRARLSHPPPPCGNQRSEERMMMMISSGITHYPVGLTAPPPKSISA
jgi:hypothetical protein